jgi:hypothetical protein
VHRSFDEQRQNGGADVTAPAAATAATAATWAAAATPAEAGASEAWPETGTSETTAEAGSEAAEAAVERAFGARVVFVDGVTEAMSRGTPLFVDGAAVDG